MSLPLVPTPRWKLPWVIGVIALPSNWNTTLSWGWVPRLSVSHRLVSSVPARPSTPVTPLTSRGSCDDQPPSGSRDTLLAPALHTVPSAVPHTAKLPPDGGSTRSQ